MGFAAIARVTDDRWITCSVQDNVAFGLKPGDELQIKTTICNEIKQNRRAVIIDNVSEDDEFRDHHTPAMYGFQSYISVPIIRKDGSFFGTLCAIDPKPAKVNTPAIISMFKLFTDLISSHLGVFDELTETEAYLQNEIKTTQLQKGYNKELKLANEKLASAQKDLEVSIGQLTESNAKLQQAIDTGKMGTWSINPATLDVTMSDY